MERVFKFKPGDVVRAKENRRPLAYDGNPYNEHLTVMYCFWGGAVCCYVLNTGSNDICIVCDEEPLELEERAPRPEGECLSYYLGRVYRINDKLVAAEDIDKAIRSYRDYCDYNNVEEQIETVTLQDKGYSVIQTMEDRQYGQ